MANIDERPSRHTACHPRLAREYKTVRAMIDMYCRAHHRPAEKRCAHCQELLAYAQKRLAGCRFQHEKPACGGCPVHCYKASMRQKVKAVMRFSGPRMFFHHPLLAVAHLLDKRRQAPQTDCAEKTGRGAS